MDATISLFQKHCEKVIAKLPANFVEEFKLLQDEESRIKSLYDLAKEIPVPALKQTGKSLDVAQKEKMKGNNLFAKKNYKDAILTYNKGIITCPQDNDSSKELLSILVSNRSATFFELEEYKKVLNDIDYVMEIGHYPLHLQYKLWLRKAKCYANLSNLKSSEDSYNKSIEVLKYCKLNEAELAKKLGEIEASRSMQPKIHTIASNEHALSGVRFFNGGNKYVAAHNRINFAEDDSQGRFAVATQDIETGSVIVEEQPHGSVISNDCCLTNCQNCAISVEQPFSCPNCAFVVYCSSNCERQSNRAFHSVECSFKKDLIDSGASVNCALALRIISQKPLTFFKEKCAILKKVSKVSKKIYRADDYDNVYFLCRNQHLRKPEELIHFTCMAVYLLNLLKSGAYFKNAEMEVLSDDEVLIGGLILRHLELLQFNAHELSELRSLDKPSVKDFQTFYENQLTGAAVYPTLALFNHSCDPCIVRYNVKNTMIVRTIKPIKAGDTIYENYGPLYMSMEWKERQAVLRNNYFFECLCTPCVERWPKFEDLTENEMRIQCKTCSCVFVIHTDDDPFQTCKFCNTVNSLFPVLKGLMELQELLPEAEALYSNKQLEAALKIYIKALNILHKYLKPPHPDIVKIQQRVRVCMIHNGNKSHDYHMIL